MYYVIWLKDNYQEEDGKGIQDVIKKTIGVLQICGKIYFSFLTRPYCKIIYNNLFDGLIVC